MGKVKRAKSKTSKFQKCKCVERTVKGYCNSPQQCPHIHFKTDAPDREQLGHNEYLNLLCTPKGYRWPPFTGGEEGEEEEEENMGERGIGRRLICQGQKVRKADRAYVHNFLAEVWALLTPEMVNRLKEMLQNEFKMSPEEALKFIDKQRELNIERSTSVSLYKKPRKLNDGTVVWDSVVKPRKKSTAECSKSPKYNLGLRNGWIKELSNMLSAKASNYVLETLCAERTSRQQEIAQTLLNRFNNFLEQEASMQDPKTQTHKTMVMMADKLSIWLDKNVKVSKSVGIRLRQLEEEREKKRFKEEMRRREQERRDREEESKGKKAEREKEEKFASEIIRISSQTEHQPKESEAGDKDKPVDQTDEEDDDEIGHPWGDDRDKKDDGKPGDGEQGGEQQPLDQGGEQPPDQGGEQPPDQGGEEREANRPPSRSLEQTLDQPPEQGSEPILPSDDIPDGGTGVVEQSIDEKKPGDDQQTKENTQERQAEMEASSLSGLDDKKSSEKIKTPTEERPPIKNEPIELVTNPQIQKLLDLETKAGEESNADGTQIDTVLSGADVGDTISTHAAPEIQEEEEVEEESPLIISDSIPPSSESEFEGTESDAVSAGIEPSKDSETLVAELLESPEVSEEARVDDQDNAAEDRTDKMLEQVAEIIADTREEPSPLQEAIKDIMEKELEERLGDQNVEAIDEVAGKVGTWMDKMVEQAAEEYGERRPPVRGGTPSVSRPTKRSLGVAPGPGTLPVPTVELPRTSKPPGAALEMPSPSAVSAEGLKPSIEPPAAVGRLAGSPVTQKPKGPIFELRKVDTKNIFNVIGPVTNTKAKRKIRRARRGKSSTNRVSEESLDVGEWAEWAGLVSEVGQNWAKWIEGVTQGAIVERPDHNADHSLSHDAKEWKSINKELKREGDVWMEKVIRKGKKTVDSAKAKVTSAGF